MAISKFQSGAWQKAILKAFVPLVYGTRFRTKQRKTAASVIAPRRILLLNDAHIGDIVIATSLIPILRSAYPSAEIGFVVGSWAEVIVRNHPEIAYVHRVDHWQANRSEESRYQKLLQFRRTRRVALKEIRELNYDVAISIYTQFPDLLDLCWSAQIPVRIGYVRSLFSSLATDLVEEPVSPFVTQSARLAETLRPLSIDSSHFKFRQSTLPASDPSSIQEVCSLLQVPSIENAHYRIIHMGSGAELRELPISFWRELAEKLSPHWTLLFTGRGNREQENIAAVTRGLANCVDACNRLSWQGFVAAVRHAETLYGVESMAGHVAAAVGTKCVVVYSGTAGVARWRPEGINTTVMTNHVPCAPCHLLQGCPAMTCMQNITPDDLIRLS